MSLNVSPQPFDAFLKSVRSGRYEGFRSLPGSEVESPQAFEEMQAYLLHLYRDAAVEDSFVDTDGQVLDCIPNEDHPAPRR